MKPLRIVRTVYPNGKYINWWKEVEFIDLLCRDKWGNLWFVWTRLHKENKTLQS